MASIWSRLGQRGHAPRPAVGDFGAVTSAEGCTSHPVCLEVLSSLPNDTSEMQEECRSPENLRAT